ncbi:MAG TPA: SDR family oxidoreductase [Stellaceae bacterium]|nr:SDR family oxidoreductase [Stellaceae bacterium]
MSRLFCFGLGYSAEALARSLMPRGWEIAGTAREEAQCAALAASGFDMHLFQRDRPLDKASLAGASHVLVSVPPDEAGDPVLETHGDDLAALPELQWLGYLSTTGVYGDRAGATVDETTPPAPANERGRRRLAAETAWRALARRASLPLHIFRLAGIYGPGRNVLDAVREGRARRIEIPGHVFSRIHVADLAEVLRASIARPDPGALYNVADDEPAAQADVVAYACRLLRCAVPRAVPLAEAGLSPLAQSFYDDNKRVANRRIKDELGVRLRYPTYREGLAAILAAAPDS